MVINPQVEFVRLNQFIDFASSIGDIWGFIVIAVIIVISIGFIVCLRKKLNKESQKQISTFSREGKYIKELYIELNDTNELLRYFLFSNKWKHRIIKTFNSLFNNVEGHRLKVLNSNRKFQIPRYMKNNYLTTTLEDYLQYFTRLREQNQPRDEFNDYWYTIESNAYTYKKKIEELILNHSVSSSQSVLLIGNAGNGKTNTLCHFTNLSISNKYLSMFINAKDIKNNNCYDYFIDKLSLPSLIADHPSIYISVINFLLKIRRKHLFVTVDAINENDNPEFLDSLGDFIDNIGKHKRIRVLMSCRSEYFEARYKLFFESCLTQPTIINTSDFRYGERAKNKILSAYTNHFNFQGKLLPNARRSLFRSLILMRIFFEVYKDKNDTVVDLNNYEIYRQYLQKLKDENTDIDLQLILNQAISIMVANNDFNHVEFSLLNIDNSTKSELEKIFNNNFLMNKTLIKNEDLITEESNEYFYFVFDELRDFCIAKHLLNKGESNQYVELFRLCDDLFENFNSPLEGILKYSYVYFKDSNQYDFCSRILEKYGRLDMNQWQFRNQQHWYDEEKELFANFGISIIFSKIENILELEKEYILNVSKNNSRDFWHLFFYFLSNEVEGATPNNNLLMDILFMVSHYSELESIFNYISPTSYDSPVNIEDRIIFQIYQYIEHFNEKGIEISIGTRCLILIIFTMYPTEHILEDFVEQTIDDENVLKCILTELKIDRIKNDLMLLKERFQKKADVQKEYLNLLHKTMEFGDL